MEETIVDHSIVPVPGSRDVLSELVREGARRMLAQAIDDEVSEWIDARAHLRGEDGHRQVVRNGHLPSREILTGAGRIEVRQPRVRDRRPASEAEKFTSRILPPYLRKAKNVEELIPWLYLKGISTGDFSEALTALLGPAAPGLSATSVTRLKEVWLKEWQGWNKRSLEGKEYVYVWVDGVHFNIRLEEDRQCILVLMGATADGKKEVIAIQDGYRESEQSWKELLLDCQARGLTIPPKLAVGDGALGFWKACRQVWPTTREQRCWVHKTANILDKLPKGIQKKAKSMIHDIWQADTRADAGKAFDLFLDTYQAKYPKATDCLAKDRDELLAFYDFPAEHWGHLRTTNPIESTFATVRLRTAKTKGTGTRKACLSMVFKLLQAAQKRWRTLNGAAHLPHLVAGTTYVDGVKKDAA
jgi:transposase-like protein